MARTEDPRNAELEASTRKWMSAGLVLMVLFALAFPLYRIYEPTRRAEAREDQQSFLADKGSDLFDANCVDCHGPEGVGAIAPALGAKEFLESVTDTQIRQLTAVGVPGTEMVAYSNDFGGPLTATQIESISVYLRSLEEDAPSIPNWRTPLVDSDYTSGQLFSLACARCHGVDAEGIEDIAPDISQDSLTMLEDDDWIARRIAEGYKEMPRFNNVLSAEQIAGLVTWLRYGDSPPPTTTTTTMPTTTTTAGGGTTDTTGATTTTLPAGDRNPDNDEVLALGRSLWTETFGFDGCQECHGLDMRGTSQGPSIVGTSRSAIVTALKGVPDMEVDTPLTNEEIEAIYQYMTWLFEQDR
jgi:mono/diheme cytochrome c family protein